MRDRIWLYDRWYGLAARERLRQLALWSPLPVYVYLNCGLPYHPGIELVQEEMTIFQEEDVVQFWTYEGEDAYSESLSVLAVSEPTIISADDTARICRFVDTRIQQCHPDPKSLGFRSMEGMLLEQVVLRRRFFAQAISGVLGAETVGDAEGHVSLYQHPQGLSMEEHDVLRRFFDRINVPSLLFLEPEEFLELRSRSRAVLPELIAEMRDRSTLERETIDQTRLQPVDRLTRRYESELRQLVEKCGGSGGARALEAFGKGTLTEIENQLVLFYLSDPILDLAPWFAQSADGSCRLALLLLEWKAGRFARTST